MKKTINAKRYDTETAKKLAEWDNGLVPGDINYVENVLYRKLTGEYFMYFRGGANTEYSESRGNNNWVGGERITPLTPAEAKSWGEERLTGEKVDEIFGELIPEEPNEHGKTQISLLVPNGVLANLRAVNEMTGATVTALIIGAVQDKYGTAPRGDAQ